MHQTNKIRLQEMGVALLILTVVNENLRGYLFHFSNVTWPVLVNLFIDHESLLWYIMYKTAQYTHKYNYVHYLELYNHASFPVGIISTSITITPNNL